MAARCNAVQRPPGTAAAHHRHRVCRMHSQQRRCTSAMHCTSAMPCTALRCTVPQELAAYYGVPPVVLPNMAHDCMLDTRWQQAAGSLERWLEQL